MEISRKLVALGSALAFTVAGCAIDAKGSLETLPSATTSANPVEDDPLYGGPEAARRLLGSNAALNIIDVSVANASTAMQLNLYEDNEFNSLADTEANAFVKDLHRPKGKFRSEIAKSFAQATLDRYKPSGLSYVKTQPITLDGGCVDYWHQEELGPLTQLIKDSAKQNKLNFAVIEAFGCKPPKDESGVAGFASPDTIPVIMKGQSAGMDYAVIHEGGHYLGLPHAGIAECSDATTIQGCTPSKTADDWSVMSYQRITQQFTVPELYELGLLRPDEVVDVRNTTTPHQEVKLTDMSHKNGVKLIVGQTAVKKKLYLSWGKDDQAGYKEKCVRTNGDFVTPKGVSIDDVLYWSTTNDTKTGKLVDYACYMADKTNQDHSLQMRVSSAPADGNLDPNGSLLLVVPKVQPMKRTNEYPNRNRSFMYPPQKVYATGETPIRYISANHQSATVKIG